MDRVECNVPRTPDQNLRDIDKLLSDLPEAVIDLGAETLTITRSKGGEVYFKTTSGHDLDEGGSTDRSDSVMVDGTLGAHSYANWSEGICIQRGHGGTSQARIDYLLNQALERKG